MGFGRYSEEIGPMDPHHHAEEIVHVLNAHNAWVRHGPAPSKLGSPVPLEAGITLHFPELEWHVFEFGANGVLEIIYFYGQVDNIRPEEITKSHE